MPDGSEGQIAKVTSMGDRISPCWWIQPEIVHPSMGSGVPHDQAIRMFHTVLAHESHRNVGVTHAEANGLEDIRCFIADFNYDTFGYEA